MVKARQVRPVNSQDGLGSAEVIKGMFIVMVDGLWSKLYKDVSESKVDSGRYVYPAFWDAMPPMVLECPTHE